MSIATLADLSIICFAAAVALLGLELMVKDIRDWCRKRRSEQ